MEENDVKIRKQPDAGNPRKPEGDAGAAMLDRMNESHYAMTGWALEHLNFQPSDRILDIGCGGGMTLHRMAEKVPEGHLTGVDYSPVSVEKSKDLNQALIADGKMEILEGSVEKLPFADGSFDKIVTVESFYFWPNPQENLKEVRRVLKDGGHFLLVAETYENPGMSEAERVNVALYNLYNPTKEQFLKLMRKAGFSETKIYTKDGTEWIAVDSVK